MDYKEEVLINDDYFKAVHKTFINSKGEKSEEWSLILLKDYKDTINKLLELYKVSSN